MLICFDKDKFENRQFEPDAIDFIRSKKLFITLIIEFFQIFTTFLFSLLDIFQVRVGDNNDRLNTFIKIFDDFVKEKTK